ncbi:unnamed protein product [Paramecium primaurelia]|uniref:Uncharacterized protein n=1 Tax=Paramecium primaurelia TaxID=5886 RepID=A0A8S1QQU4_PARPR|nr:unnamed protein product [Paramecium primaurelia]
MKTGNWIELFENFWDKSQVTFIGLYLNNKKQGKWQIYFFNQKLKQINKIGEGYYDYEGISQGYWINLHRNFYDGRQIIYKGSYNNGTKQGWWDISFHSYFDSRFKKIGGGYYNRDGKKMENGLRLVKIFGMDVRFQKKENIEMVQKLEFGNLNQRNIQMIIINQCSYLHYQSIFRGLGCYNIDRKNGKWIEIHQKSMRYNYIIVLFILNILSAKQQMQEIIKRVLKLEIGQVQINKLKILQEEVIIIKMDRNQEFGQKQKIIALCQKLHKKADMQMEIKKDNGKLI